MSIESIIDNYINLLFINDYMYCLWVYVTKTAYIVFFNYFIFTH